MDWLEILQKVLFYYTVAFSLYAIPKYLYLLFKKTIVISPLLLLCSVILAGTIIVLNICKVSLSFYYQEGITGGFLFWVIFMSCCFVLYNLCYWIMTTFYIDVKQEAIIVHSLLFSRILIDKKDVCFSKSYNCYIPREFKVNQIILIPLKDGRNYKLGFDRLSHFGNTMLLYDWFIKAKKFTDPEKFKELLK